MDLTKTLRVTKLIINTLRLTSFSTMDLDGTLSIMGIMTSLRLNIMTTNIASIIMSVILFLSMMYITATSILVHSVYVY